MLSGCQPGITKAAGILKRKVNTIDKQTQNSTQTLKGMSGSVSVGSLGPGVHKVCLSPPSISGGYGV